MVQGIEMWIWNATETGLFLKNPKHLIALFNFDEKNRIWKPFENLLGE